MNRHLIHAGLGLIAAVALLLPFTLALPHGAAAQQGPRSAICLYTANTGGTGGAFLVATATYGLNGGRNSANNVPNVYTTNNPPNRCEAVDPFEWCGFIADFGGNPFAYSVCQTLP